MPTRDELIDRITRIVLAELGGGAAGAVAGAARGTNGGAIACARCDAWGPCPDHCGIEVQTALAVGATRVSSAPGWCPADDGIRSRIDHTLLKPEASREDIIK